MSKVSVAVKTVGKFFSKNASTLATAVGIVGMVGGAVEACRETPKFIDLLHEKEMQKTKAMHGIEATEPTEKLTPWETITAGMQVYWPAVLIESAAAACFIFANHINLVRLSGAIAACKYSEEKLQDYQEATLKTVGEKKETDIRNLFTKERLEKDSPKDNEVIIIEGGNTLFYDEISGRYFRSSMNIIERAANTIDHLLNINADATLNDFYEEIGLPQTEIGDILGWTLQEAHDHVRIITSGHKMADGEIITGVSFNIGPTYVGFE